MFKRLVFILILSVFCSCAYAETVILKSGRKIEGAIVEKTSEYVKVDFYGTALTYFLSDIDTIDGVKIATVVPAAPPAVVPEPPAPVEPAVSAAVAGQSRETAQQPSDPLSDGLMLYRAVIDRVADLKDDGKLVEADIVRQYKPVIDDFKAAAVSGSLKCLHGVFTDERTKQSVDVYQRLTLAGSLVLGEILTFEKEKKMDEAAQNYASLIGFLDQVAGTECHKLYSINSIRILEDRVFTGLRLFAASPDLTQSSCEKIVTALSSQNEPRYEIKVGFTQEIEKRRGYLRDLLREAVAVRKFDERFADKVEDEYLILERDYGRYLNESVDKKDVNILDGRLAALKSLIERSFKGAPVPWDSLRAFKLAGVNGLSDPKSVAQAYLYGFMNSMSKFHFWFIVKEAQWKMMRAVFAVRLYQLKNGVLPSDLTAVQSVAGSMAGDPYNRYAPFKYKVSGKDWCVFSIGPERINENSVVVGKGFSGPPKLPPDLFFFSWGSFYLGGMFRDEGSDGVALPAPLGVQ